MGSEGDWKRGVTFEVWSSSHGLITAVFSFELMPQGWWQRKKKEGHAQWEYMKVRESKCSGLNNVRWYLRESKWLSALPLDDSCVLPWESEAFFSLFPHPPRTTNLSRMEALTSLPKLVYHSHFLHALLAWGYFTELSAFRLFPESPTSLTACSLWDLSNFIQMSNLEQNFFWCPRTGIWGPKLTLFFFKRHQIENDSNWY